uniref:Uncharacterized protein n=1 Tax=Ananas comosus var. bracteatus TaxID=296719 RepID=A0A6V7NZV5_ANACO|nr:unnamed protein product [Ananas comosus var. bracteatus]
MEKKDLQVELGTKECFEEALPPVLKLVSSQTVAGFDCVGYANGKNDQSQTATNYTSQEETLVHEPGTEVADTRGQDIVINLPELSSPIQMANHSRPFSLSFSLPSSPSGLHIGQTKTVIYTDKDKANAANGTWSGRLERQLSNLRGKPQEVEEEEDLEANSSHGAAQTDAVPAVERYFDALEGPELDTLRATEVSVLPEDKKWPFLLRFPVNAFGICLGVSSQAILWKTLATSPSMTFLRVSPAANLVLWFISLALMGLISLIYSLKVIFYYEAVRGSTTTPSASTSSSPPGSPASS